MDDLLQKYNDYMRLKNCRAEYLFNILFICIIKKQYRNMTMSL